MKILAKIIIVLAAFLFGFYGGVQYANAPDFGTKQPGSTEQGQEEIKVSLMLDFGEGEIKTFNDVKIQDQNNVFTLLEKVTGENNIELKYKDYGGEMGVFVEAIGGQESDFDADCFWQFWVNNEYAQVGPSSHKLQAGDVVEWKYTKGQFSN